MEPRHFYESLGRGTSTFLWFLGDVLFRATSAKDLLCRALGLLGFHIWIQCNCMSYMYRFIIFMYMFRKILCIYIYITYIMICILVRSCFCFLWLVFVAPKSWENNNSQVRTRKILFGDLLERVDKHLEQFDVVLWLFRHWCFFFDMKKHLLRWTVF